MTAVGPYGAHPMDAVQDRLSQVRQQLHTLQQREWKRRFIDTAGDAAANILPGVEPLHDDELGWAQATQLSLSAEAEALAHEAWSLQKPLAVFQVNGAKITILDSGVILAERGALEALGIDPADPNAFGNEDSNWSRYEVAANRVRFIYGKILEHGGDHGRDAKANARAFFEAEGFLLRLADSQGGELAQTDATRDVWAKLHAQAAKLATIAAGVDLHA